MPSSSAHLLVVCLLVPACASVPAVTSGTPVPGSLAALRVAHHAHAPEPAAGMTAAVDDRHITIPVGSKASAADACDPVEEHRAAALRIDVPEPATVPVVVSPIVAAPDVDHAGAAEDSAEGAEAEDDALPDVDGYRYTFEPRDTDVQAYLGAGMSELRADVNVDAAGPNDMDVETSTAAYLRAGVGFDLLDRTRLGLDYRHLFLADVNLGAIGNADFDQVMLTLGVAF